MKKVLLIITIALLIFQMVVLATDIDIGAAATDRGSSEGSRTYVLKDNPANEAGTITSVEIWANTGNDLVNCEVATFFVVSGNNLSTRDTHTIGAVTSGSKQTFSGLDIDVEAGDYIGIYFSGGRIEIDTSGGAGMWYNNSDQIPCTDIIFSSAAGYILSVYGTGAGVAAGRPIFFGTNF